MSMAAAIRAASHVRRPSPLGAGNHQRDGPLGRSVSPGTLDGGGALAGIWVGAARVRASCHGGRCCDGAQKLQWLVWLMGWAVECSRLPIGLQWFKVAYI